jgi:hypothetical protein
VDKTARAVDIQAAIDSANIILLEDMAFLALYQ